ncbi:hypothetical protein HK407_02g03890 [Ordospora pajunii]|uniref:uncharacterized protein n=1 Tax=Ordospora pajunii TaxID=3039483 RepID=UPI0029527AB5|nr:uncharacterized protein HK407_02g03890 [Ordospora pajunii]KAH9411943.1 hypothetical protein HK407_02g03890 [Ordospora pajunii]
MLVAAIVTLVLAVRCSQDEDSSVQSTDNVFKKFLEVAISDAGRDQSTENEMHGADIKDMNGSDSSHVKRQNPLQGISRHLSVMRSEENTAEASGTAITGKNKKHIGSKQKKAASQPPDVQPDLTFETPISASLLLKPSDTKKEIVISQGDIKEMSDGLKDLEKLIAGLNAFKNRLKSILKKTSQPPREDKPSTDLLNYNFIEVTENTQAENK